MPKPKPGSISINMLAAIGEESYSRPPEAIAKICLQVIRFYSKRGRTTIDAVERVAEVYAKDTPQSASCISIFLSQVAQIVGK